jgi:hypothetical protein
MAKSPTSRSLEYCRAQGWSYFRAEHYNYFAKKRYDAFGFADILVLDGEPGTLYVQATTGDNAAARREKILQNKHAKLSLQRGNRIEVWAWRKLKDRKWHLRRDIITLCQFGEDLDGDPMED